ncbi:MAG TPA: helix-turn-helix domain-containing protein [Solirubrobacterales bacterium]|nr:helix-turn-helix domain-containing protein [Solirubrobacterales bacterium]
MAKGENRRIAERLAVMADPLRSAVVDCLVLAPATIGELADEMGVPAERIRYQVKRLRRAGIVSVHEEKRRRGAVEYVYVADSRRLVSPGEEAGDRGHRQRRHVTQSLRSIFKEALQATQAGAFRGWEDCGISRVPLRLDPRGFGEVRQIIESAVGDLFDVREKSSIRLQRTGETARPVTTVLLFFETPR